MNDLRALLSKHAGLTQRLQLYRLLQDADPENANELATLAARSESRLAALEAEIHRLFVQVATK